MTDMSKKSGFLLLSSSAVFCGLLNLVPLFFKTTDGLIQSSGQFRRFSKTDVRAIQATCGLRKSSQDCFDRLQVVRDIPGKPPSKHR